MGYQDTYHSISDVGSWWNFQISFCRMITIIWHHLQVHQEPPCPPRLQLEIWGTVGVLTGFLMLDLDKTFTEASERWSLISDTNSMSIRNLHDLHDSKKRLGRQEESWQCSWCWILMKISYKLYNNSLIHLTSSLGPSGTSMSSKTPGRDLENR